MNTWFKRIGLHQLLGGLLGNISGKHNKDSASGKFSRQTVHKAIDSVVNGTEPMIKYISAYKKLLQKPVITSLQYIDELVDNIPGPVEVNSKSFATDPQVHAWFASSKDISRIFSNSAEIEAYFDAVANIDNEQAYALLCMTRDEKTVLGMELQDDILRRDVLQTAVNFSEHKIMSPAATEDEVRKGIKKCIFDGLITNALQNLIELKNMQRSLQQQQCLLQSRLRSRQAQAGGLSNLLASAHSVDNQCEQIMEQITANEEQLKTVPQKWDLARHYLDQVKNILEHPGNFIRLECISININRMGIKVSDKSTQDANLIHIHELTIANVLKRVVAIVHYPRNEMQSNKKLF